MENQNTFTQYALDRDIPLTLWDHYLIKYSKQYVLRVGEKTNTPYKTYCIKCYHGFIEPYSIKNQELIFYGKFATPNKKTYFLKSLSNHPVTVLTNDYDELSLKFKESNLSFLCSFLRIKKRIKLSDAEHKKRSDRAKNLKKPRGEPE